MKSLLKHYRLCNIWICLFIVAMAFTAASDRQYHSLCVTLAFGAGGLMYSLGVVKEWTSGNPIAGAVELILASCMWTATICSILLAGGIL